MSDEKTIDLEIRQVKREVDERGSPQYTTWNDADDQQRIALVKSGQINRVELLLEGLMSDDVQLREACQIVIPHLQEAFRSLPSQSKRCEDLVPYPCDTPLEALPPDAVGNIHIYTIINHSLRQWLVSMARITVPELADLPKDTSLDDLFSELRRFRPEWQISKETPIGRVFDLFEAELGRLGEALQEEAKQVRKRLIWPSSLPQPTFQEVKVAGIALADGPTGCRWEDVTGQVALRHSIPGETLQTMLSRGPALAWWGLPDNHEALREELREAGAPCALFYNVIVEAVIQEGEVTATLDDLIKLAGLDTYARRSRAARRQCRRQIWRWLLIFSHLYVWGVRSGKYRDPDTKQLIDLTSKHPLIQITEEMVDKQMAFDNSEPPIEVTIEPGKWLERMRGNRRILSDFGNVRKLTNISAGKPSGAWAQSIGLALHQRWRESSSYATVGHSGENNNETISYRPFTRRDLLTLYRPRPEFDVYAILDGPKPARAREYWNEAITILQRKKVVGNGQRYREITKLPPAKSGVSADAWKDAWLDQELDIRPTDEGIEQSIEINKSAANARRARARKRGTQKQ